MKLRLKPLSQQIIVITGATSGHGLCTARMAASAGARVMLAARDENALRAVRDEIRAVGGVAEYTVTDVTDAEQVENLARNTIASFGSFDTWVNNAGIGVYAHIEDLSLEDHRQNFETNYWGVVHGSMTALRHLRHREQAGAIINIGSINGDMGSPLLTSYNATKHAVKGFTDSMRIEALAKDWPVSVTLIKPSAIGTPFPQHGRNLTGYQTRLPEPLYHPHQVAKAILNAAEHPRRSVTVGGRGKFQVLGATMLPAIFDRIAGGMIDSLTNQGQPVSRVSGNLYEPQGNDGHVEGRQKGKDFSAFTAAGRHPKISASLIAAIGLGVATVAARRLARA